MGKNKAKGKLDEYTFDLEKDLKDPVKLRAAKEKVEERTRQLKDLLRRGEDKKNFDQAQTLLHGYIALQKVMQRVNRKMF